VLSRSRWGVVVVGVVLLAGCSSGPQVPDVPMANLAPVAGTGLTGDELLVWSTTAHVLGPPVVAGDVVLGYVSDANSSLALSAWSALDGSALWSIPASPGAGAIGITLMPETVTDGNRTFTAVTTNDPAGAHSVVVVDVATGAPVPLRNTATTNPSFRFVAYGRPSRCGESDPAAFCVPGGVGPDVTVQRTFRIDPIGGLITLEQGAMPDNARALSGSLWATNDRPPEGQEVLGRSLNGATQWSHTYDELFGPGYSSDVGWNWTEDPANAQIVGSINAVVRTDPTWNVASVSTVALAADTGAVRWRADGVDATCGLADVTTNDLWCRSTGTVNIGESGFSLAGPVDVTLERFDRATGNVVWSLPLGDAPGALDSSLAPEYAGNDAYKIVGSGGTLLRVRLADGSVEPVAAGDIVGCIAETEYQYHEGGIPSLAEVTYPGQDVVQFCHPDGSPATDTEVTTAALDVAGTPVRPGLVVVATPTGVRGYRVP
jgi:hypothetical protein